MGIHCNPELVKRAKREPAWWAKKVLGVNLWDGQIEMMEAVRDCRKVAVKACHAPGKTFTAAVLALWVLTNFYNSIVISTAPTNNQVENLLWREIRALHAQSRVELGGSFTKRPQQLNLGDKWYGIGLSPNEPERFQGFHAPFILIIVDEASGVSPEIMGAIEGIMMSGDCHLLLLSNPTRPEGSLYDAFHKYRHVYRCISIGAFDTPNLKHLAPLLEGKTTREKIAILRASGPPVNPHLVTAEAVAELMEQYGEDSQLYKVRVLAEFPSSSPDQLIDLWLLEDAVARWKNMDKGMRWWESSDWKHPRYGGLDPARFGDNLTSLAAQSENIWAPLETYESTDTIFTAARAAEFYQRLKLGQLRVDEHGLGGGPLDLLKANPRVNAVGITVGSQALDSVRFGNLRAEAYWGLRDLARSGQLWLPDHPRLIGQLSCLKYKYKPNGQIFIESKEEMRARGVASPDEADAVMLSKLTAGNTIAARSVGQATDWGRMCG